MNKFNVIKEWPNMLLFFCYTNLERMWKMETQDHETRISRLEENDEEIFKQIKNINDDLKDRYSRIDESNKHLRELSLKQNDQNAQILNAVLKGNQDSEKRADERKKSVDENRGQLLLTILGSGGIIYIVIDALLKVFGG